MAKIRYINKIILLFCAIIVSPAYSLDMCVENNSVAVVLDPTVTPKSSGSSIHAGTSTFKINTDYGILTGVSACLTSNYGIANYYNVYKGALKENNKLVVGGEKTGRYCWCKLTHPVSSLWVYIADNTNADTCSRSEYCLTQCKNNLLSSYSTSSNHTGHMRAELFSTIGKY